MRIVIAVCAGCLTPEAAHYLHETGVEYVFQEDMDFDQALARFIPLWQEFQESLPTYFAEFEASLHKVTPALFGLGILKAIESIKRKSVLNEEPKPDSPV
jgi:hypothetical protein